MWQTPSQILNWNKAKSAVIKFKLIFLLCALLAPALAFASGPIETSPYAVQGVEVDETDASAKLAKDKALVDVQMKAIAMLGAQLGDAGVGEAFSRFDAEKVMPLLKSLSIEKEVISPGRYQGTFTVRFLPERVKPLLQQAGVHLPQEQGPAMLVIPVWTDENGRVQLWEDNPWRKAWLDLHASQAQIPILIPLGDQEDDQNLTAQDITANNAVKLEAIRRRYDVKTMLIAMAQPAEGGGVHAHVVGKSPLGKITIDKIYTADTGQVPDSASVGAQRFQQLITDKFRSEQAKSAMANPAPAQSLPVTVPFAGPSQWNGLRSRILSTPGVVGLDVTSLEAGGASAKLFYNGAVEDLGASLQTAGLQLVNNGGTWTVVPL
ncbi:DUF2066 domain-containing protein [Aestuariivirga litoralis]|uniref:DUF2066 domain-containing protein n=1 Tax=Aestuariivirga litoralis TaxID=2650924 RepID=UPI0018C7F69D|nr:DUF2066 domain-containing protein [Aestuariivirga litoralis]MBG1231231.1 DUF2066 domain-containing protein [Aestuariivirga litoralis]